MTIGGIRYLYDRPYLMSEGLHMVAAHPGKIGCLYDINKQVTGKNWEGMWQEVSRSMYDLWKKDADRRAPYTPSEMVLPESKRYTDYTDLLSVGSDIYTIKKGHNLIYPEAQKPGGCTNIAGKDQQPVVLLGKSGETASGCIPIRT